MASKKTFFATFGSAHLGNFHCDPMKVIVFGTGTETALRTELIEIIGSDKFCTTYPYDTHHKDFTEKWGYTELSLVGLEVLRIKSDTDLMLQDFWVLTDEYKIEYAGKFPSVEDCETQIGETPYCALLNDLEFKAIKRSIRLLPNQGDYYE